MSFASVAGLDAHRQRCNMKVRCDVNKLKGEGEVEGNNNLKQGVCEDSKPPLDVSVADSATGSCRRRVKLSRSWMWLDLIL